ncbi:hypothetical protein [Flavobacterium sp. 1]|uniref:hypothetical protein n=1 Tax=Flavobacterium sp. 1 TaxID=2035200 RepID=UPI0012FDC750|nr:hypothetical protein [Flavobacterium sp. 1]
MKTTALALMEMESLDGINLFFPELAERPPQPPPLSKRKGSQIPLARTMEKKVYDGELVMDCRK